MSYFYSASYQTVARALSASVMFALVATPFMALLPAVAIAADGDSCVVVSNSDVQEGGADSFELVAPYQHAEWTATVSDAGAKWIWGDAQVATPTTTETQTFTIDFDLTDVPSSATLEVAADNGYTVAVGDLSSGDSAENNFKPETKDTYAGITGLVAGTNTLTITVENKGAPGSDAASNPAGLLFALTVDGADCGAPTEAPVISYPLDGQTYAAVAMVDWNDVVDDANPVTYLYEASQDGLTNPDGSFTNPVYVSGVLSDSDIPTPGTPDGTYYVHAKAIDDDGHESPWSAVVTFTIDSNVAPVIPACDPGADPLTFDPFALGTVNGQFGWQSTGSYDQAIVDNTYGFPTFGCKSLRISNAVTSGSFGDQTFSFSVPNEAGESTAENGGFSGGTRKNHYEAEFDFASTKTDYQPGLAVTVSPDRGDGARMSYLRFEDSAGGIDLYFYDVQGQSDPANFVQTQVANDLPRATTHTAKIVMDFVEGPASAAPANDVVKIYVDGNLVWTGTSWENYYRFDDESNPSLTNTSRTVDSLLFRVAGTAAPANDEYGFLFDNMSIETSNVTEPVETATVKMCKYADTYPDLTPLEGWTLTLEGELDSVSVLPNGQPFVIEDVPAGEYTLRAIGQYTYRADPIASTSDAAYSFRLASDGYSATDEWVRVNDFPMPYTGWLGVMLNDSITDWGSTFSPTHEYEHATTTAATSDFSFKILDDQYGDNSGQIDVSVNRTFSGVTGADGCVTFEDVPLGDYVIGEEMQDGWENESGLGEVTIDEDSTFDVINHNDDFGNKSCVLVSDATTLEGGTASDLVPEPHHSSWTAVVDALSFWIWGDEEVDDPTSEETQTFTKSFWLESLPAVDATLTIAADNSYMVELNGTWSSSDGDEDNYTDAGKDVITIPASELTLGANTLVFTVTNLAMGEGTQATNPAGLNYKLVIPGVECQEEPIDQDFVQVHIYKYIQDAEGNIAPPDAGDASFPMTATWDAQNIGASSGSYALNSGNGFAQSTAFMTQNADYETSEVTDGSVVVPQGSASCPAGKYRLVGYQEGNTFLEALNDNPNLAAPDYDSLDADKYVIVVNEDCDELDVEPTEQVKVHIYKYLTDDSDAGMSQVPDEAGIEPFPMTATWQAANLNGGATTTGAYVLGNNHGGQALTYAADTSAMDEGANYTTSEVTGENGVIAIGGTCVEDAYRLVGYKTGATLEDAMNAGITDTAPEFFNLETDQTVIVVNEDCDTVEPEPATLIVTKNTLDIADTFSFTLDGEGEENDGNIQLSPAPENAYSDYVILELPAGTYTITENVPDGYALSVTCLQDGSGVGMPVENGKEIALNEGIEVSCTFTNIEDDGQGPTPTAEIIKVIPSAMNGWSILNFDDADASDDTSTTTSGTQGTFVFGPVGQPIGDGSLEQKVVNGNDAHRLITSDFNGIALGDIKDLQYSTYVAQNGGAQATYIQIRIDRDANGRWDDALFFEPVYQNGSYGMLYAQPNVPNQCGGNPNCVDLNTWQTWDAFAGGWWSDVDSAGGPPLTTISEYVAQYPNAVLATDVPAIRVQTGFGAPVWDNFLGNADKFVIRVNDGVTDHTTTYDFDPEPEQDSNGGGGGGGGGSSSKKSSSSSEGQVLGASTDTCSALLTTYMGLGKQNDAGEVTKLQGFLNEHVGAGLPLTGFFGNQTHAAVKTFQTQYWQDVLEPWFQFPDSGITSKDTPTGYVFKTTRWKINDIVCPGSEAYPELP